MIYKLVQVPNSKGEIRYDSPLAAAPHLPKFDVQGPNFGYIEEHTDLFLNTFMSGDENLGVLLTGIKGSGKTRTAEVLSNKAIAKGYNVLLVAGLSDINLTSLVELIEGLPSCVVFFDEFAKVISKWSQDSLLSLFSGSVGRKKLFLLTENGVQNINEFMLDRPGRIRYRYDYSRLSEDEFYGYCNANGVDKLFFVYLEDFYKETAGFTMDHLKHIIMEHKLYPNKSFEHITNIMNIPRNRDIKLIVQSIRFKDKEMDKVKEVKISRNRYGRDDTLTEELFLAGRRPLMVSYTITEKTPPQTEQSNNGTNAPQMRPSSETKSLTLFPGDVKSIDGQIMTLEGNDEVIVTVVKV